MRQDSPMMSQISRGCMARLLSCTVGERKRGMKWERGRGREGEAGGGGEGIKEEREEGEVGRRRWSD